MRKVLHTIQIICIYLFIILFVYASVSKLIDFENFKVQVAQSPLLSAFSSFIAYAVVIGELIIAFLLCFPKVRTLGLYLFLGFMTAFTVYIYLILNYSPFVPCSCGGVLEKMGWTEHLWFNIVFCFLAIGCIINTSANNTSKIKTISLLTGTIVTSTIIVVTLFLISEHIMKKENPFVRRFLPHPLSALRRVDLFYNSYYIAGVSNTNIYLGNTTAPLHGLVLNFTPKIIDTITLKMEGFNDHPFSSIKWNLIEDTLFIHDHTVSTFLKSNIENSVLKLWQKPDSISFSLAIPISNHEYALRTYNSLQNNVNLSILNFETESMKKFEGILDELNTPQDLFSNDGMLLYNKELKKIIYVFYYKNKSFVFDHHLENKKVIKTIDTITKPNFDVIYLNRDKKLKMSENGIMVNKLAATSDKYLYIASDRIGKNENKNMYRQATIIDVYNLKTNSYESSFYFYHHKNKPINQLYINNGYAIGIGSNFLAIGKFREGIYN